MGECMRDIEQYAQSQELWNPSDHTLAYDSEPSDVEWRSGKVRQIASNTINNPDAKPDPAPNWIRENIMPILSDAYDDQDLKPTVDIMYCQSVTHDTISTNNTITSTDVQQHRNLPQIEAVMLLPLPKEGRSVTKATSRTMQRPGQWLNWIPTVFAFMLMEEPTDQSPTIKNT